MLGKKAALPVMVLGPWLYRAPLSPLTRAPFSVHFAGGTEFAGCGPVSLTAAQPLGPLIEPFGPPRDCALRADITKRVLPELGLMSGTLCRCATPLGRKGWCPAAGTISCSPSI